MALLRRAPWQLWTALGEGLATFKKAMVTSSPVRTRRAVLDEFNRLENRVGRYRIWWALYENNLYDDVHRWDRDFKRDYALPREMRGCYNPCFRLGNFWGAHTWIGRLDATLQNGRVADSAIPILTDNPLIRPALGRLWRDSGWAIAKELTARTGAVMGDVGLRIEDDPASGKVRIVPVNPATLTWVRPDRQGNVDAYVIHEPRFDPRFDPALPGPPGQQVVIYEERVTRDGATVTFETFLDGEPYGWDGNPAVYDIPYGFVPLVLVPHMRALPDSCWGWGEFQGVLAKAIELDRVASELHSQIRKASDPRFFVAGTNPDPGGRASVRYDDPSRADREPREHQLPMVYGGMGSTCVPMVYPLDIQFTSMEIQNQLQNAEKDYPELRYDSARAAGDASAKALREVRKAAEAKVHGRRVTYDSALVRAHQMALAIGGWRGYDGYEDFDLGSYASGDLDHEIGERTVFLLDPLDRTEEIQAQLTAWQTGKLAGIPDGFLMSLFDFDPAQMALFEAARVADLNLAVAQHEAMVTVEARAKAAFAPPPAPAPPPAAPPA